jgi:predicted RNA methylase
MSGFHRLHSLRMDNDARKYALEEMRPRFGRLAARHEEGTAPRAVSAFNLFQTPPTLADRLVAMVADKAGAALLEPSAGLGRLLDASRALAPSSVVAVELAPQLCAELYLQNRPGVKLKQGDFLEMEPEDLGLFDCIVMNPPFHMRADIRHIHHALKFLKPGGKLAALAMDTHHRAEALRPMSSTWEQIPAGAFKSEGTNIAAVLLTITK